MANKKKTTNTKKSTSKKRTTKKEQKQKSELNQWITIVILSAITVIAYSQMGLVGIFLNNLQRFLFGNFYYVIMILIVAQIIVGIINKRAGYSRKKNPVALILIVIAILLVSAYLETDAELSGFAILEQYVSNYKAYFTTESVQNVGGGLLGALLFSCTTLLVDRPGTIVIIVVLFVVAALLLVNLEVYKQAYHSIKEYLSTQDIYEDDDEFEEDEYEEEEETIPAIEVEPKQITPKQMSINLTEEEIEDTKPLISQPSKPVSALDIRVDTENQEEDILDEIHEEQPQPVKTRSVFMNVDDLLDPIHEEIPVPPVNNTIIEPEEVIEENEEVEEEESIAVVEPKPVETKSTNDGVEMPETPKMPNRPYRLPKITLLDPIPARTNDDVNLKSAKEKGQLLIQVLQNFDIKCELLDTHIGPAVTKFEIRPEVGVKVSKILNLADDIKMQLAVKDVRIEAPIPGHNAVGIEIPNIKTTPVKMKELVSKIDSNDSSKPLLIFLGKDLLGNAVTCRLDKMPHLLIAGATGSGKSVCMNSIITSLLLRTKPDEVKMLLVDPKKVEFTPYHKIPHLIGPVINDPQQASNALKVIVKIMDDRYDLFAKAAVRNIGDYNAKVAKDTSENKPKPLPYIVVIIDELADLMVVAGKDVESSIQRITQLARAAGIHLIVATQRPSTDVITGIIKANIPSRIAFSVSSGIDSRTILDHVGAERLLGNGDMLYMPIGESNALRVQGVYVTDEEVQKITEFVSSEAIPMYDDAFIRLEGIDGNEATAITGAEDDPLYKEVKDYVIDVQKASTSLLQRRFGIGYNRAARMIEVLESQGIIGPAQGSKPRDVYIKRSDITGDSEEGVE